MTLRAASSDSLVADALGEFDGLAPDVDGLTQHSKRRRFWHTSALDALADHDHLHGTDFVARVKACLGRGIVLTSSYSGMGCAEAALGMLQAACEEARSCLEKIVAPIRLSDPRRAVAG
eukprot:11934991-Alexandrium_andersonii.AAC.1